MFNKIFLVISSTIGVILISFFVMWISCSNKEIALRNAINSKQIDNKNEFDNLWKKISQVSEVSLKDRETLEEIFNSYAESRTSDNNDLIFKWVSESIPNVSSESFTNLQNIISSSRDSWTMRQKELIDLKREHDNMIDMFPSSIFVGSRGKIEITIITSNKANESMESGIDDNVSVFGEEND